MKQGILYIATESSFIQEAKKSARSVRNVMPDVPIALVTEASESSDFFDEVVHVKNPHKSFRDKPSYMSHSPFDRTIYFDTDIKVNSEIPELFDILEYFDIAVAQNTMRYGLEGYGKSPQNTPPKTFPEYNTGVISFNTKQMKTLQKEWIEEYKQDKERCRCEPPDQPSFRRVLYQSNLRIATLPRNYNCVFRRPDYINGEIKVFHGRLSDIDSMGAENVIDYKYASSVLNDNYEPRIFDRHGEILKLVEYNPNKIQYFIGLTQEHGFITALNKLYNYIR